MRGFEILKKSGCNRLLCLLVMVAPVLSAHAAYSSFDHGLSAAAWTKEELAKGVDLFRSHFEDLFGGPQYVNILRVDLEQPGVRVEFAAARHHGRRTAPIPAFVESAGALAATNGGFGHGGRDSTNSGIFKIDGEVLPFLEEEPEALRFVAGAALGIDEAGEWLFRNRPGQRWPEDWPEVRHALAGGHRLIENGEIHASLHVFTSARDERHAGGRHPRTAIGLLPDRTALLITFDGRHAGKAEGVTLLELGRFMKDLGCVDALNLDGGGSTTMWVRDRGIINYPSENGQFDAEGARFVRSAVIVLVEGD